MPTRAEAFDDIMSIVDWVPPSGQAIHRQLSRIPPPASFSQWLKVFGQRAWVYVAGFADLIEGIPAYRGAQIRFNDSRQFLDYVKGQKALACAQVPRRWTSLFPEGYGGFSECSAAQVGKANQPGVELLRFDKACLAILSLDLAMRNVAPQVNIYNVVSIVPATTVLECDAQAAEFLQGRGRQPQLFRDIVNSVAGARAAWNELPQAERDARITEVRTAARLNLYHSTLRPVAMTNTTANAIAHFVRSNSLGAVNIAHLSEQHNASSVLRMRSEKVPPRNGTDGVGPGVFV